MSEALKFNVLWAGEQARTLARLSASLDGAFIWPAASDSDGYLEVFADDILTFLVDNWHFLLLEQTYPILEPSKPSNLRQLVESRWEGMPLVDREDESIKVEVYEQRHNLATCFAGIFDVPPLWFVRSLNFIVIDNGRSVWKVPFRNVISEFERLGDEICDRLAGESKFLNIIRAWRLRNSRDALILLAASIGTSRDDAEKLVGSGLVRMPVDINDAANDEDELRIAARVTGSLSADTIRFVLETAQSVALSNSERLDILKRFVQSDLVQSDHQRAYDVGSNVAIAVREYFTLQSNNRVDLELILGRLGVSWRVIRAVDKRFKGLAIWGRTHGPGIIVSEQFDGGPDLHGSAFQRVTIAHELGHLLMDGDHAIGAVDVLDGRVPHAMEQRAKAFAGEFLLPSGSAVDGWQHRGSPRDQGSVNNLVDFLRRKYGVTRAVAAWKLEHGLKKIGVDLSMVLDEVAPTRWNSM